MLAADQEPSLTDDQLLAKYIEADPARPGPQHARLRQSGAPVWALVGYYKVTKDAETVAHDYDVSPDEVRAVLRYYKLHRQEIDAKLIANAA